MVPEGKALYAAGNTATCNFQGFLLQLAVGAPMYNCSLSLYYLLMIKYNWSETQLVRIERWVHVFILTVTIGTSFALLPLDLYNHIRTVCWIIGEPQACGNSSRTPSDVPCNRGDWAWLYGILLFYSPIWICVILMLYAIISIYLEVRRTHARSSRWEHTGEPVDSRIRRRKRASNVDRVALQAFLYASSFVITWTPSTIWSIAHWVNKDKVNAERWLL